MAGESGLVKAEPVSAAVGSKAWLEPTSSKKEGRGVEKPETRVTSALESLGVLTRSRVWVEIQTGERKRDTSLRKHLLYTLTNEQLWKGDCVESLWEIELDLLNLIFNVGETVVCPGGG